MKDFVLSSICFLLLCNSGAAQCSITAIVPNNVSCKGKCDGSAFISTTTGTAPYSFSWSTGSTAQTIQNLCPNSYTVSIIDNVGCSASTTVTITEPLSSLSVKATATPVNCNSTCNGSLTATASGGVPSYSFSFIPTGNSSSWPYPNPVTINALCANCYTVYVTDANGCSTYTSCIMITEPPPLVVTTTTTPAINGQPNGSTSASVIGGTMPYKYDWWPNGASGQTVNGLPCGTYTVYITDAYGCSASSVATVACITGINEADNDGVNFSMYPNPATSNIIIETAINKRNTVQLTNLLGEIIYSIQASANKINIDVGILPKGIYVVQIRDALNNISGRQRLVIR